MAGQDKLHVVVFTDTFFETNGVGSYYRTLLNWCRGRQDFQVTVICPARDDLEAAQATDDVIPVRSLVDWKNPFYRDLTIGYFYQPMLRRIVRELAGSKVVHVATSGPLGVGGAVLARRMGLPLVGCYHTDLNHYARLYGQSVLGRPGAWVGAKVAAVCDKLAYGRCEAISAPTESAARAVRSFYDGPTAVIPNPVDVDWFHPGTSRQGRFRDRYGRGPRVLAAVVGRVAKEKNLDLVCELLGSDRRLAPVFVGDGPYAPTLRRRWGAEVTGFLHGQDLREAYQQSDLFVSLSESETYGLTLAEALACGLPAMVLRSQGLADSIPKGAGVDVLEKEDLPTLADRCVALVSDRVLHAECSRRVRDYVLHLGADIVVPKFVGFHGAHAR